MSFLSLRSSFLLCMSTPDIFFLRGGSGRDLLTSWLSRFIIIITKDESPLFITSIFKRVAVLLLDFGLDLHDHAVFFWHEKIVAEPDLWEGVIEDIYDCH